MHGQGKFTFASGASYQGCFDHNKFQGEGTYSFPDGKQYQVGAVGRRPNKFLCVRTACHLLDLN
jgi:hypothetical protein